MCSFKFHPSWYACLPVGASRHKKCAADLSGLRHFRLLLAFALLVSDTAAGLASRLAGCLAFAAAAVLCALAEILCLKSLDTLHFSILPKIIIRYIIAHFFLQVNSNTGCSFICYISKNYFILTITHDISSS